MRRAGRAPVLLVVLATAACTQVVAGTPAAAPGPPPAATTAPPAQPDRSPASRSGLASDVVADECLLDAGEFAALVGQPVREPEQVDGPDGSSCSARSAGEDATPLAAVNVYLPRAGTAAEFVRHGPAGGRRALSGTGEAAAVVDTDAGPTLQLADTRHVVTIAVLEGTPSDDAWRAAAAAAAGRRRRVSCAGGPRSRTASRI